MIQLFVYCCIHARVEIGEAGTCHDYSCCGNNVPSNVTLMAHFTECTWSSGIEAHGLFHHHSHVV